MLLLYVLIWNTMFGKHIIFKILKGKLHFYHIAKKKKKKHDSIRNLWIKLTTGTQSMVVVWADVKHPGGAGL